MYQITYFESPKCKNSMVWERGIPPPPPPTWGRRIFCECAFPISFGIDNIPTNSPNVCTWSLTLSPENAKSPITPSHTWSLRSLAGHPPKREHETTLMVLYTGDTAVWLSSPSPPPLFSLSCTMVHPPRSGTETTGSASPPPKFWTIRRQCFCPQSAKHGSTPLVSMGIIVIRKVRERLTTSILHWISPFSTYDCTDLQTRWCKATNTRWGSFHTFS